MKVRAALAAIALLLAAAAIAQRRGRFQADYYYDDSPGPQAEFHFIRVEYVDHFQARRGFGRGWWRQDWPDAEVHFNQGLHRLTRIAVGQERHIPLTDDRVFDYPWIYATQTGFWDLRAAETDRSPMTIR
jgi:hypothetical protein